MVECFAWNKGNKHETLREVSDGGCDIYITDRSLATKLVELNVLGHAGNEQYEAFVQELEKVIEDADNTIPYEDEAVPG